MRFRARSKKLLTTSLLNGTGSNHIEFDLDPRIHGPIKQLLLATGEPFAGDAVRVILAGLAASDNAHVFTMNERSRVLVQTFRDMLSILTRETMEHFNAESERQLVQFIEQIHATEETQ